MQFLPRVSIYAAPLAIGLALSACSGEGPSATDGPPLLPPVDGDPPQAAISYHRDVKPIIDQKCGACHQQEGIAPFALTTFAEVSATQGAIKAVVLSGAMPPWPPAKSCGEYVDDRSLSEAERATLTAWIDAGAPEGDPRDAPPGAGAVGGGLSRVDVTLALPEGYTPTQGPDEYRCFLVDWPETETTHVTGFGVVPGNAAIVHHVIAYLAKPDEIADYEGLDAGDPGPGYSCFGGPGGSRSRASGVSGWIGGWAPGSPGADFPAGTGLEVVAGSKMVVQVHYNTVSGTGSDSTKLQLKVDKTVEKKALVMPLANPLWVVAGTMVIPAHADDTEVKFAADLSPILGRVSNGVIQSNKPFTIHSASLHMHGHGTRGVTSIKRKGGEDECMLQIDEWNFHWQGSYGFVQPKQVNPGDKLYLECHYQNRGPTDIKWGEGTGDEMCLGNYYLTQ